MVDEVFKTKNDGQHQQLLRLKPSCH